MASPMAEVTEKGDAALTPGAEQHNGWQVGRRYFSAEVLAKLSSEVPKEELPYLALAR